MGLAVVNGQLYAVGGFDGTTYLKNVETFDQEVITRVLNIFDIADQIRNIDLKYPLYTILIHCMTNSFR